MKLSIFSPSRMTGTAWYNKNTNLKFGKIKDVPILVPSLYNWLGIRIKI